MNPKSRGLELHNRKYSVRKEDIASVAVAKTREPENPIEYLHITLQNKDVFAISGRRELINLFYCCVKL